MLSVCIPIYNYDVRDTVRRLAWQAARLDVPVEIVCIDDASAEPYRSLNAEVMSEKNVMLVCLDRNVGRSRIRNLFLSHTAQPYLLFLDCDSLIIDDSFLQRYVDVLRGIGGPCVVCGGRVYPPTADRRHRLRHRYGVERECRSATVRSEKPYASFMTNNFVVSREVLANNPFDESLSRYGHEDTLFGLRLAQQQVSIVHIDNPVLNGDVEENSLFLRKTREGVENLVEIYLSAGMERDLEQNAALVGFYKKLNDRGLSSLVRGVSWLAVPLAGWCLKIGIVSVKAFSFYKLCLFARSMARTTGCVRKKT